VADQFTAPLASIAASLTDIVAQLATIAKNLANAPGGTPADVAAAQSAASQLTAIDVQLQALAKSTGGGTQGPPVPTLLNPATGPAAGGTPVMVTGTGLTGATAVLFGTVPATGLTLGNDTELSCTSPAGAAGSVEVTVVTPVGTSAGLPYVYV
jgi:hypothetical protein